MRLRRRSRRPVAALDPAGPFDAWTDAFTTVGNLDSVMRPQVDRSGRVHVPGWDWVLDWWIGAEDRWHRPAWEAAVRQQLVGNSPVVETRVRIPSGDAVARAYGARGPRGEDLLVFEVENDSKVPFALALAVGGEVHQLALRGSELVVDDQRVWLARSPGRVALSTAADERAAGDVVQAGDAEPVRAMTVTCDDGAAEGVLLFPLAHTATLRIAVALDGMEGPVDPATLPSAGQVASGWASHTANGARIEVPDRRLREAVAASTRFLLLDAPGRPSLEAIAARWCLTGEPPADDPLALAALVQEWLTGPASERRAPAGAVLPAIAEALDALGEARAAQDVRAIEHGEATASSDDPYALLGTASPTWAWATERAGHDLAMNAALVLAVRQVLVAERAHELAMSPVVPEAWLGTGWEVHDLPTAFGRLSFAIRWHGDRPALLWELEPTSTVGVRLTTPALDPTWSSTDARGEALLAPVAVPERPLRRKGITLPVTIEPVRRRS